MQKNKDKNKDKDDPKQSTSQGQEDKSQDDSDKAQSSLTPIQKKILQTVKAKALANNDAKTANLISSKLSKDKDGIDKADKESKTSSDKVKNERTAENEDDNDKRNQKRKVEFSDNKSTKDNVQEPSTSKSGLTDSETKSIRSNLQTDVVTKILIENLARNSAEVVKLSVDPIIGYVADYSFQGKILSRTGNYFKQIEEIPSYFEQVSTQIVEILDVAYTGQPLNTVLNQQIPIIEDTLKIYNNSTSVVSLHFNPKGFDITDAVGLKDLNIKINPFSFLGMSNVKPQSLYDSILFGNMLQKLIVLYQSSNFILANLKYIEIATPISNNRIGSALVNHEIMVDGEPHILYLSHSYTNEFTSNEIYNVLYEGGTLQVKTGRVPGTKKQICSIIYTYDAYLHTDQYVTAINNLNYNWLLAHKLSKNIFLNELRTFATEHSTLIEGDLQVYFNELCMVYAPSHTDYENYMFSFYLFPHLKMEVTNMLISQIEKLGVIKTESPIEYLRSREIGKSDATLIAQLFTSLKVEPSANLVTMIVLEFTRMFYDFEVKFEFVIMNGNILNHIFNIFAGALFFPFMFSRLVWFYYPILYTALRYIIPSELQEYINTHGMYVIKKNNRWVPYDVGTYTRDLFEKGVMPSLLVLRPGNGILNELFNCLQPRYYEITLNRRAEANFPYLNKDYKYSSSWPIGNLDDDAFETQYLLRINGVTNTLLKLFNSMLKKGKNEVSASMILKSSTSGQTLNTYINGVATLFQESGLAFLKIAGPIAARFMQMPFVPGNIIDIERVTQQTSNPLPSSSQIGITAYRKRHNRELVNIGFSTLSARWTFNPMPFLNAALNFCLPNGRGLIIGDVSEVILESVIIPQLNCHLLYDNFRSLVFESKEYMDYFYIFISLINEDLNDDIHELITKYLPTSMTKRTATEILKYLSTLIITPLQYTLQLFSTTLGDKVLEDPRGINFTLGIIDRALNIKKEFVPGSYIGYEFKLSNDLLLNKLSIFTSLLTSEAVPNLNLGEGLMLGQFVANRIAYTDTAPVEIYRNIFTHNKTFTLVPTNSTAFSNVSNLTLQYTYKINDDTFTASIPSQIKILHTLVMKYPSDIRTTAFREFLIEAVQLGKLQVVFTKLRYTWTFFPLQALTPNYRLNHQVITDIFGIPNDSEVVPNIVLYDSRQFFTTEQTTIINAITRWVLPLEAPRDIIISSGLFDMNRQDPPYIKRNFFTYDHDIDSNDMGGIGDFPRINNKAHVLTDKCIYTLPVVEIMYANELT